MSKLNFFLPILIFIFFNCSNEDNPNNDGIFLGDIILRTQEDINDFGSYQYKKISGDLTIITDGVIDNIIDLSPLNSISRVDNLLAIYNCSQLESIEFKMTEVGILTIINTKSKRINFPSLKEITSDFLIISDNSLLETISFNQLTSTGSELRIINNPKIENLDGFQSLTHLGSNFGSGLQIRDNPMLLNLSGLNNVNSEVVLLEIVNNYGLSSLNGINNIYFENIRILSNDNLTNFCAIKNTIEPEVNIDGGQEYYVIDNKYNPTAEELINGNCSQ
ncbi:hypothetical protein [uncultured Wocania sp.]|uniref:hypothetical protein n=1 Tax=uncultured Wocania sp. TaxID=2834404 RepID=UPI0030FC8FA2